MPLEFDSLSHGKIAFGFFNIETDMILLGHYFLWLGGFPRWKNDIRPEYVLAMKGMIEQSQNHIFDGLILL